MSVYVPPGPSTALPVFNGAVVAAASPPPPVSGGTVRIVKTPSDAAFAVVSDPDEDSIHVVSMGASPALVGTIALQPGDLPNRIIGDAHGHAHVVLRGGGAIATIDVASATLLARRNVCPAPRGIDYDPTSDTLYVACATGELVTLPSTGPITQTVRVDGDLRDVVVDQGQVYVSRFRSAELLKLGSDGSVLSRSTPIQPGASVESTAMDAVVAWRTVRQPGGGTVMLHQLASDEPLIVVPEETYYAETGGAIVVAALTTTRGGAVVVGPQTLSINPAIDVTFDATGAPEVLSIDGKVQLDSSQYGRIVDLTQGGTLLNINPRTADFTGIDDGTMFGVPWVVVQQRAPSSELLFYPSLTAGANIPAFTVTLSQNSHVDTGFDIFHLPTIINTACMSCHPEGGDDGHAWKFSFNDSNGTTIETRLRRTQSLLGGIVTNGAPYHWDGDLVDLQVLCDEVFTHRMGGGQVTANQVPILARWLNAIPTPPVRSDLDPSHVANGQAIFNGPAGCVTCHAGPMGTLAANQDIGKTDALGSTKALRVPMLLGVWNRAPYMHDGCAATLMDRLTNPQCAGTKHGTTTSLAATDLQDLETYLESL